jgi:hypothetical protein
VFVAGLTAACGGSEPAPAPAEKIQPTTVGEMSPEEAGGMSAESSTLKEAEGHASPHGGTLVKLGTVAQLEFVHDPSSGLLTAYVLDAAGAAVTRIPAKAITVEVTPGGGTAAALKGVTAFTGVIKEVVIGGETFKDVKFGYPVNG